MWPSRLRLEPTDAVGRRVKALAVVGIALLALLQGADTVTTRLVLQHTPAGAVEANPLAGLLLASGNLLVVKLAIVALLGMAVLKDRPKLGLTVGIWLACGLYVAAVLSNILVLRML